jgi:hypothetical protein
MTLTLAYDGSQKLASVVLHSSFNFPNTLSIATLYGLACYSRKLTSVAYNEVYPTLPSREVLSAYNEVAVAAAVITCFVVVLAKRRAALTLYGLVTNSYT